MAVTTTPEACQADWVYVDTIERRDFTATTDQSLKVLASTGGRIVPA